jgi:uncharacterized protein YecA (UPF0149 family)
MLAATFKAVVGVEALLRCHSGKEAHLAEWDRRLRTLRPAGSRVHVEAKVGRNDRCPCGSGLKYKHCHGLGGRSG